MWPFNRKKKKEAEKPKVHVVRGSSLGYPSRERTVVNESRSHDLLTDPLLSPLSPISPFFIGGQEESQHESSSSHDSGSSHHDSGHSHDFGSSHDSGSSYDSSGSDSSSCDSGGSSDF